MRRWLPFGIGSAIVAAATALFLWSPAEVPIAAAPLNCPAGELGQRLNTTSLLWGGQMDDAAFSSAPFTLRYRYLAGPVPAQTCSSCLECAIDGVSCENPDGCGWWGCWQDDALPPGQIAASFVADNERTLLTYYTWMAISGFVEGRAEVAALADSDRVRIWMDDLRFLAGTLSDSGPVILHIEPDLLGFLARQRHGPDTLPLALDHVPECVDLPHTAASLMPCWSALVHAYAPDVLIAVHVSGWAAGEDVMRSTEEVFVADHARRTVDFLRQANLTADLLVLEASDRDAGFDGDGWGDAAPSLDRALAWATHLTNATDLPHLWWQVPMGTAGLDNACGRYADDRVRQFVEKRAAVAAAGAVGVAFGAGAECMSAPESDGGAFLREIGPALVSPMVLCGP